MKRVNLEVTTDLYISIKDRVVGIIEIDKYHEFENHVSIFKKRCVVGTFKGKIEKEDNKLFLAVDV